MRDAFALRGGFSMMSMSGGLNPSAVAGRPSVTKFTHSSCTGMRASGIPRAAVKNMLQSKNILYAKSVDGKLMAIFSPYNFSYV
jgi:hypothetical protein